MSRACAIEWQVAIQMFDGAFNTSLHCSTLVRRTDTMSVPAQRVLSSCIKFNTDIHVGGQYCPSSTVKCVRIFWPGFKWKFQIAP